MTPYYLLEIDAFDRAINEFFTPTQMNLEKIINREPVIQISKQPQQIIDGFIKYDLTCEIPQKQKGRAYGTDDIFEYFIRIEEKTLYYCFCPEVLIVSANRTVFDKFTQKFSKNDPSMPFKFKKLEVDFSYIIENQYSQGVKGVWLGDYPDVNIHSMYLIGNKIEDSTRYQQLISQGVTITNITILYDYNNDTEKIMITKDGGIILYRQTDETDALPLVKDVYDKLLTKI